MGPGRPEGASAALRTDLPEQVGETLTHMLGTGHPPDPAAPLWVGLSGGRDSLVLLHLLRFFPPRSLLPGQLRAIHVEHGMHPDSRRYADWVRGVCLSWGIPLTVRHLAVPPGSEAEAREARYACFRDTVTSEGGVLLLAHHAEDQAETVLFRLLRGTGPRGLAGIPAVRPLTPKGRGWLMRPLLEVSGERLQQWVLDHHLRPREDPSNVDLTYRRNWIRHALLPALGPEVRAQLLQLAHEAGEREKVLERVLAPVAQDVGLDSGTEGGVTVDRRRLNLYPPPVRAELIRALVRGQGGRISRRGMAMVLRFMAAPQGSGVLTAGPGLRFVREGKQGHIHVARRVIQDECS